MLRKQPCEPPDAAQAFRKAADYCALQERCKEEVRAKMKQWGVINNLINSTIERLVGEGFIDEQRYATAFARGKFRLFDWGKTRIAVELKKRRIPQALITNALNEIDDNEYWKTIESLIFKKTHSNNNPSREEIAKLMNYLAGKGFEPDLVGDVINQHFRTE